MRMLKPEIIVFLVAAMYPVLRAEVCCFPKQLEGNVTILSEQPISSVNGPYHEVYIDMSVDLTEQRIREYFPQTGFLQLMFFKEGVVFQVDHATCVKGELSPLPNSTVCVPEGAKLLRNYQIGMNRKLNVTDYIFSTSQAPMVKTIRTVTDMCVPVEDKVFWTGSDSRVDIWTYENLTPGIKDQSVFDVPSICKSSPKKMKGSTAEGSYFLRNTIHGTRVNF